MKKMDTYCFACSLIDHNDKFYPTLIEKDKDDGTRGWIVILRRRGSLEDGRWLKNGRVDDQSKVVKQRKGCTKVSGERNNDHNNDSRPSGEEEVIKTGVRNYQFNSTDERGARY